MLARRDDVPEDLEDRMRENVVGRANVEDTPELKAYYKDLEKYEAGALWTVANKIEPWAAAIGVRSRALALQRSARARAALGRAGLAGEGGAAGDLSQQSRPPRRLGRGRLALFGIAGDAPRRGRLRARALGLGAALHHGRVGRLHHRRRSQDDAGRARFRAHAERHLARARRRSQRLGLHLAGRPRHPARQRAGGQFLRGPSEGPAGRVRLSRRRHDQDLGQSRASPGRLDMVEGLFAAVQIRVGADLRVLAQIRRRDRRLALSTAFS